jgi:hypothetical protein
MRRGRMSEREREREKINREKRKELKKVNLFIVHMESDLHAVIGMSRIASFARFAYDPCHKGKNTFVHSKTHCSCMGLYQ